VLKELQAWVHRNSPPLCTFIPERHRDANLNTVNQATFRSLSRILYETHTVRFPMQGQGRPSDGVMFYQVAVAFWGSDALSSTGIVIYPAENSSSLLVGAIFLTNTFPPFILGDSPPLPPPAMPLAPLQLPANYTTQYPSYSASSRSQSTTPPQLMGYNHPPADSESPHFRQPYRYLVPPAGRHGAQIVNPWLQVKSEDNNNLGTPVSHQPHYARP